MPEVLRVHRFGNSYQPITAHSGLRQHTHSVRRPAIKTDLPVSQPVWSSGRCTLGAEQHAQRSARYDCSGAGQRRGARGVSVVVPCATLQIQIMARAS